jgi:hypothetical protein
MCAVPNSAPPAHRASSTFDPRTARSRSQRHAAFISSALRLTSAYGCHRRRAPALLDLRTKPDGWSDCRSAAIQPSRRFGARSISPNWRRSWRRSAFGPPSSSRRPITARRPPRSSRTRARGRIAGVVGCFPPEQPEKAARMLAGLGGEAKVVGIRHLVNGEPDPDWKLRDEVGEGLRVVVERVLRATASASW